MRRSLLMIFMSTLLAAPGQAQPRVPAPPTPDEEPEEPRRRRRRAPPTPDRRPVRHAQVLKNVVPDSGPGGTRVSIEGDPSLRTHFMPLASFQRRDATIEEHVHASDIATAMQAVNTIPALCEAPAGIRGTFELMPAYAGIGFRPV